MKLNQIKQGVQILLLLTRQILTEILVVITVLNKTYCINRSQLRP